MADHLQGVVERIVGHLADVLAVTSGHAIRALPAVGASPIDWQVPLTLSGAHDTALVVGVSAVAAQRIAGIVLGGESTDIETDLADTLKELVGQATAAYVNQESTGLTIAVGLPVHQVLTPPASAWQHDLVMESDDPPRVSVWIPSPAGAGAAALPPLPARDGVGQLPVAGVSIGAGGAPAGSHRNLDVVLDLELPITVRFGETRLTLDALARLGAGSLIDLERAPDDPVELLVNGRLVARGEVVVVAGCYGVRIREVVSAADRLRSLEG